LTRPRKPRDVGNGLVCASFGAAGEWLSLSTLDPTRGVVELTGLPVFDPELRGNVEAVLRYRSWMRREEHAFLRVEAGRATVTTREEAPRGTRSVVQRLVISAPGPLARPAGVRVRMSGRLASPVMAQLHEAEAPLAESGATSRAKPREGTLRVRGEGPPVIIQAWLRHGGESASGSAEARSDLRLAWRILRRRMPTAVAWLEWPAGADEIHLDLACTFDLEVPGTPDWLTAAPVPAADASRPPAGAAAAGRVPGPSAGARDEARPLRVPARLVKALGAIDQRAASYARTCTALRAGPGERCLLVDHRILPLSRTRDAYWQARLLLATWARGSHRDDAAIVADHLRWLFLRCERPDGRWTRTHRADGRRRDMPFQADQQLYPLLELCDHLAVTGQLPTLPEGASWPELAAGAWAAAEGAIEPGTGLIATEEDATDTPPPYPFVLADQILLWYTATRLAGAAALLELPRVRLLEVAERARASVGEHFVMDGPTGRQWARAVDGRGGMERSVDACDVPLALAPLWGFCKPSLPAWRATIRFAFDPANPAATEGPAGGLGSRQLPGTWTLGDVMAWAAFGISGDRAAADAALERLVANSFSDGMLPEAYDPDGSGSVVRHWFAWPGAALATLVLEHAARDAG
jgi:hypothetical protein